MLKTILNAIGGIAIIKLIGYLFVIKGTFFFIITTIGMIRFDDFYIKLHISSKCLTAGGISLLIGIIILEGLTFYSLKLLLIIIFLVITNPVATHALARAAYYHQGGDKIDSDLIRDDLKKDRVGDL
ncbi:MAG: monovalent cation/H(+) antiporter subunit G [Bacillota bacterium]